MPVIAVINRKGGSGKSTLATHLAAYCANADIAVMLGDVDQQQSTQTWLRRRGAQSLAGAQIVGWAVDPKKVLRAPSGITHVVLDTPGGMRGFELARLVVFADAILMPVCNSAFDRESAADCYAELLTLPRVASGRCKVAAVGMRLDARTSADEVLKKWAARLELPFIGVLRETQAYVRCIERGLTLFDLPAAKVQADMEQWEPILQWLGLLLHGDEAAPKAEQRTSKPITNGSAPAAIKPPLQGSHLNGTAAPIPQRQPLLPRAEQPIARPNMVTRLGQLLGVFPKRGYSHRDR